MIIKNLIYHLWPTKHTDIWRWNVNQILKRIDLFNGQRLISVVTDKSTHNLETVKAAFKGTIKDHDFFHFKNDPTLGEVVSFEPLMKRIENIDERQLTFYAHGKGTKYKPNNQFMFHRWSEVMYSNLLDYPNLIEDSLKKYTIVGTFKKSGNIFGTLTPSYHFAGTFFWFKNDKVFGAPSWNHIPRQWWGVEAWPGIITSDADCLLLEGKAPQMQLYHRPYWEQTVNTIWHRFQLDHVNLHRHCSYQEICNSLMQRQIVVTGPQRSGTMIAAKILATELKIPFLNEEDFNTHDFHVFQKLIKTHKEFVIQAPTMSAYCHLLPCSIVFMRRNLQDILRSQKRINWQQHEQIEKDRYFDHSNQPSATIKINAWEQFQRIALGERAFDLNYESLKNHPLWIDKDKRSNFGMRQYSQ